MQFLGEFDFWLFFFLGGLSLFYSITAAKSANKARVASESAENAAKAAVLVSQMKNVIYELSQISEQLKFLDEEINHHQAWRLFIGTSSKIKILIGDIESDNEISEQKVKIEKAYIHLEGQINGLKNSKKSLFQELSSPIVNIHHEITELVIILNKKITQHG